MHLWMEPEPEVSMDGRRKLEKLGLAGTGMGNSDLNRRTVVQGILMWESMKLSPGEDLWPLGLIRQIKTTNSRFRGVSNSFEADAQTPLVFVRFVHSKSMGALVDRSILECFMVITDVVEHA